MDKTHKSTTTPSVVMRPTGDPTMTHEVPDPPKTDKERKAAKKLRKEQRKGNLLWVSKGTKSIVNMAYKKQDGASMPSWFIKFSDGTELWTNFVTVMYSRDNPEHHIRVGYHTGHYDKLSNKQYEALLKQARDQFARQQRMYSQLHKSFLGSNGVQKELEKPITKKEEKEDPLTKEQEALAIQLANLAVKLEVSPIIFSKLPKFIKGLGKDPDLYDLSKYWIDESLITIRIIKEAVKLHRQMEPRIDGVPLSKVLKPEEVKPKQKKKRVLFDQFGDLIDSNEGRINAAFVKLSGPSKAAVTNEMIYKECGLECKKQMRALFMQDFIKKTEKGWML